MRAKKNQINNPMFVTFMHAESQRSRHTLIELPRCSHFAKTKRNRRDYVDWVID